MTKADPHQVAWHPDAAGRGRRADAAGKSRFGGLLRRLYALRRLRQITQRLCLRLEGGAMYSATWRHILRTHHGVDVGRYSYGDVLRPGALPRGSIVGAYCSTGTGLIVRRRDHPLDRPFLHPLFYNSALGLLQRDSIPLEQENPLTIGHDVWIGDRVTIVGGCRQIGNGAVIGAGAVVTRDVPPYAVVGGVPSRLIRMRFDPARVAEIEASRWWEHDIATLIETPPFAGAFDQDR